MSDVFDNLIDRQSPPHDPARIDDVIASHCRYGLSEREVGDVLNVSAARI
jgi:hypothetical protein